MSRLRDRSGPLPPTDERTPVDPQTALHRFDRRMAPFAGPLVIAVCVLFATRGFLLTPRLTNIHPDILSMWLPHFCFLGNSVASGHIPLVNPYQMAVMPYASDPQSGWLYLLPTALFSTMSCATALRFFIVLNPLIAGLGLYWFLRKEHLARTAATVGGLSYGMMIAASTVAISLPFAGTLAWTPYVLVAASGFLQTPTVPRRLLWLGMGALAWGQVATAHMSHGLAMCTMATFVYLAARCARDVVAKERTWQRAALLAAGFLLFLPLANLAIFIPRFALIPKTSLRGGYAAVGGAVAKLAGIEDQPLVPSGVWAGWPWAVATAPGAFAGATVLLAVPAAARTYGKRYLAAAFGALAVLTYLLTLDLFVGAGWFRALVLHLPFGDIYLHNPGRLRYLWLLIVPVLGALGVQGFLERPLPIRKAARWVAAGAVAFIGVPMLLGTHPSRFLMVIAGALLAAPALVWMAARRRRWASIAVVGVLAVELLAGAAWSQSYHGGVVFMGLEDGHNASPQPLQWPNVDIHHYMNGGPIARAMEGKPGRFLTWSPPGSFYVKGYLFTQNPAAWPGMENGRGMLFDLADVYGYSPIQLTRYWSYIRAANHGAPLFYNAAVIRRPSESVFRLLGVRWLLQPSVLAPVVPGTKVAHQGRFDLYQVKGWQPLVSVVHRWKVLPNVNALRRSLLKDFDPAQRASVIADPGIQPEGGGPGRATWDQVTPEELRIHVHTAKNSLVVIRNSFGTGWTATVDGQPTKVLAADYLLLAVPVRPGAHEIVLTYHDPEIGLGLAASGIVWAGWAVALATAVALGRRRRRQGSLTATSPVTPVAEEPERVPAASPP
jgi:Bacterial membrane protein YfhO